MLHLLYQFKVKFLSMRMKIVVMAMAAITVSMFAVSCKNEPACGETNVSSAGGDDSHNMGRNCMSCHTEGGEGDGCFNAAGTAYYSSGSTHSSAIVKLFTQPDGQGELRATIYGDSKGNFYTTDDINFSGGLYPAVYGSSGEVEYMNSSITKGACNSCHGVSEERIEVD